MIGRAESFKEWCASVRERYERMFSIKPNATPDLACLDSMTQERMMRCRQEAMFFDISDDYDGLAILAYHLGLLDDIHHRPHVNDRRRLLATSGFILTKDNKICKVQ